MYGQDGWYPDGFAGSYTIHEDGVYRVYFRPLGDGGMYWHHNVLNAEKRSADYSVNGTDYANLLFAYNAAEEGVEEAQTAESDE